MEREPRTTDALRGLVRDLDEKLDIEAASRFGREPVVIADTGPPQFDRLVGDLDRKLQQRSKYREPEIIPPRFSERVPTWLGFVLVTILGIGFAFLAIRPWQARCNYSSDICRIAQLDIDALRVTIPESELLATLPNIDELDPNDELTAGDIFMMERFAHLDFEELITDEEIERLLGATG